jgi:hypothetical protein
VVWATLSLTDRKQQRRPIVERLYHNGFTMETIAKQLGVTKMTISNDLRNCKAPLQSKPTKTASNPKGAGRPKGSGSGTRLVAAKAAAPVLDADRASLSPTAQQKLDAAIRRYQRELSRQFRARVQEKTKEWFDQMILPHWRERVEEAEQLYARRRGLMNKETFNTIRRALHPDSRFSITDQKLSEAFNAFMRLEKFLLDEKDSPTDLSGLPRTWAEWEQAKRDTTAARRARRRAGQSSALRPQ